MIPFAPKDPVNIFIFDEDGREIVASEKLPDHKPSQEENRPSLRDDETLGDFIERVHQDRVSGKNG